MFQVDASLQHLISGIMAGMTSTITLYPLELIKTRMQVTNSSNVAYKSVNNAFQRILMNEGVLGFYRGVIPALIASSASWGGYFYCYELAKKRKQSWKTRNNQQLDTLDHVSFKMNITSII